MKKPLIFSGLAVLIIGLVVGAYLLFQADGGPDVGLEVKRWYNEAGQLHRDGDLPAVIGYSDTGDVRVEAWYLNGQRHREGGLPSGITYSATGEVESEAWHLNGELIKVIK